MNVIRDFSARLYEMFLRARGWYGDACHGNPLRKWTCKISNAIEAPDATEAERSCQLANIIAYAKKNTVFYSRVEGEKLSDFPVISKNVIREAYQEFVVPADRIPGQVGDVHVQETSGSTGVAFKVFQDTLCRTRRLALIRAANERMGFKTFLPMMHIRAVKHHWNFKGDLHWKKDLRILYADNSCMDEAKTDRMAQAVIDYGIRVIRGYMTSLDTLTRYMVEHNVRPRGKLLFISVGELLLETLRDRIVNDLHCNVVSQYGNEENGILGQSDINGSGTDMRLYLANCFVEVLKLNADVPVADGELGRIVVTDLANRAMPMIRYDIGDLAMVGERSENGEVRALKALSGRKTDLIYKTDGTPLDFWNSIPIEIFKSPNINQWQFIQRQKRAYVLRTCIKPGHQIDEPRFISLLKSVLGQDADVEIQIVDEIPVLNSGKRKAIVNEFTQKKGRETR